MSNLFVHWMLPTFFSEENSSVTDCDGSTKYGSYISIDSYKINRPCTCTLTSSFVGTLLMLSKTTVEFGCTTQVIIKNEFVFGCRLEKLSSQSVDVIVSQNVNIQIAYILPYSSGEFYHCIGFKQNGTYLSLYQLPHFKSLLWLKQ